MVVLLPLPFASVRPWAWSVMCAATGALMLLWGIQVARGRERLQALPSPIRWAMVPFAFAFLWAMLQTMPFTPHPLHHPLWTSVAEALAIESAGAISLDPTAGRELLVRWLAYAAIFLLTLQLARDRRRAREAIYAVSLAAGLYALYGLIVQFSGTNTILWFEKTAYRDVVTGPFVNRNSFATYLGIGLVCATGCIWQKYADLLRGVESTAEARRIVLSNLTTKTWPLLAAWISVAAALLLTQSRAGVFATLIAITVFLIALIAGRRSRKRPLVVFLVLALVAIAFSFTLSGRPVEERFMVQGIELADRALYREHTLAAIEDAPYLGVGLGSFEAVFRFYGSLGAALRLDKAHNDYLEVALELGIPAALAIALSLTVFTLSCAVGAMRRRRDQVFPCIGLAVITLVATHALFDFSLQIPAVAATFAFVAAIGLAQSWSSRV